MKSLIVLLESGQGVERFADSLAKTIERMVDGSDAKIVFAKDGGKVVQATVSFDIELPRGRRDDDPNFESQVNKAIDAFFEDFGFEKIRQTQATPLRPLTGVKSQEWYANTGDGLGATVVSGRDWPKVIIWQSAVAPTEG